jgi:isochorismate synthase
MLVLNNLQKCSPDEINIHYSQLKNNHTSKEVYETAFNDLHESLKAGEVKKVVLSKIKEVENHKDPLEIFDDLNKTYNSTFNYILSSPEIGCWMGATPELLIESDQLRIKTVSLAGTVLQSESWSEKEREEQQFVTDYILDVLNENGFQNHQIDGPNDVNNGIVKHLKTTISAEYTNRSSFSKTISELHPTPATCGIPTQDAMALIQNTESHDRQLYTGYILLNFKNPVSLVNLRCMEVGQNKVHLYLGGGLTAKSDCEKEWEETERKSQTLLKFLE